MNTNFFYGSVHDVAPSAHPTRALEQMNIKCLMFE